MSSSTNCCSVCVEPFNKSTKYKITCGHCEYNACRTCIKTYLIDQSSEIHCMSCKNEWTRKFLFDNIDKNWINKDYKNHCEQILLERELSLLPDTQPFVEKKIRKEDLKKERQENNENIRKL